jgi:YVTN family beta-propeller protein
VVLIGAALAGASGCGDDDAKATSDGGSATDTTTAASTTATSGEPTSTTTPTTATSASTTATTTASTTATTGTDTDGPTACVPVPPPETLLLVGDNPGGPTIVPGGRAVTPAGPSTVIEGYAGDVEVHPLGNVAYVTSSSRDDRRLVVIDLADGSIVQDIVREQAFVGLAVSPDGSRVYANGGVNGLVEVYAADVDGTLTPAGSVDVGTYAAGMVLSPDGATLWVGDFDGAKVGNSKSSDVVEVDTASLTVTRRIEVPLFAWDLELIGARNELYVSDLGGQGVAVVDLLTGTNVAVIDVPTSPAGITASPDAASVWVAVSGADTVAKLDTATRSVTASVDVGESTLVDDDGDTLKNSNVNDVWYDPATGRVYATRGGDNAVSVIDGATMTVLGAIPTGWYPSAVVIAPDGETLVVAEGKGGGAGPNMGERETAYVMKGAVTRIDLAQLDLATATDQVERNFRRPDELFPFDCEGTFPIPTRPGQTSPIEHVILIVKENKTYDCVFGDLDVPGANRDASLAIWGEEYTPNQHELARQFTVSDNFYTEEEVSDSGHIWLTSLNVTEFAGRVWIESYRTGGFDGYQVSDPAEPDAGTFFAHLLDEGIDFTIYGEIVGSISQSKNGNGSVFVKSDRNFPGGPFTNYSVKDEDKARYVADKIAAGQLKPFTYLLLPNDHTNGTAPGTPTPASMIADNDFATGIVVDALSKSPYWDKSVVFVVQDDCQGCEDHVDAHRSFLLTISPWAKRGHVSHVNSSWASVFATTERILGIRPLGRADAATAPLWDSFTATPDLTAYDVVPRRIPETNNRKGDPGWRESLRMDFRSPDRNPELGELLQAVQAWRLGQISRAEAERRIAAPWANAEAREEAEEESREETTAFDRAFAAYQALLADEAARAAEPAPAR